MLAPDDLAVVEKVGKVSMQFMKYVRREGVFADTRRWTNALAQPPHQWWLDDVGHSEEVAELRFVASRLTAIVPTSSRCERVHAAFDDAQWKKRANLDRALLNSLVRCRASLNATTVAKAGDPYIPQRESFFKAFGSLKEGEVSDFESWMAKREKNARLEAADRGNASASLLSEAEVDTTTTSGSCERRGADDEGMLSEGDDEVVAGSSSPPGAEELVEDELLDDAPDAPSQSVDGDAAGTATEDDEAGLGGGDQAEADSRETEEEGEPRRAERARRTLKLPQYLKGYILQRME